MRDERWCRWVRNGCKGPKTRLIGIRRIRLLHLRRARLNAVSRFAIILRIYDERRLDMKAKSSDWSKEAARRITYLASSYNYHRANDFCKRLLFEDGFGGRVAPTLSKGNIYRRFVQLIVTYTLNYVDGMIIFKKADKSEIEGLLEEAREAGIMNPKAAARAMFRELENELITGSKYGSK